MDVSRICELLDTWGPVECDDDDDEDDDDDDDDTF